MLNQLIGVSGTIVAAIIGFIALIISALELGKLRIEAEESKEKAKRHRSH